MKKAFLLLCTLLLVLGSLLPLAGYRLAKAVLGEAAASSEVPASSALPAPGGSLPGTDTGSPETAAFTGDAEVFLIEDQSTGEVQQVPRRDYLIGAVAAEMPLSWPDEALKAQAVAAHSYVLYCRDHATAANGAWLSADPARRQGYLTDPVLHSYWGTRYDANYIRLSALVDSVLTQVLCYEGAPAGTSYFAISNGRTEASENVWGTSLPYLVAVDSSTDLQADHYEVTLTLSSAQVQAALAAQGLTPDAAAPEQWFSSPTRTASGYVARLSVCGVERSGAFLRRALGLRSTDFTIRYENGQFYIMTHGYGHGVGLSQWVPKHLRSRASPMTPSWPTISRALHSVGKNKAAGFHQRLCPFSYSPNRLSSQLQADCSTAEAVSLTDSTAFCTFSPSLEPEGSCTVQ